MHHRQMGNAQLHLSWINNIHKIFEVHLHKIIMKKSISIITILFHTIQA
jgi:hypothetical protein